MGDVIPQFLKKYAKWHFMLKFVSYFVMTDIQQNPQWNRRWRTVSVVSIGPVINFVVIVSLRAVESQGKTRADWNAHWRAKV